MSWPLQIRVSHDAKVQELEKLTTKESRGILFYLDDLRER
jgi:hypothetical protein